MSEGANSSIVAILNEGCHLDLLKGRTNGENIAFDIIDSLFAQQFGILIIIRKASVRRAVAQQLARGNLEGNG